MNILLNTIYPELQELQKNDELDKISNNKLTKLINKTIDKVSTELNNTRAICKKSYICNDIIDDVKNNPVEFINKIKHYGKKVN